MSEYRILVSGGIDPDDKLRFYRILDNLIDTAYKKDAINNFTLVYLKYPRRTSLIENFIITKTKNISEIPYRIKSETYDLDPNNFLEADEILKNRQMILESDPNVAILFPGYKYNDLITALCKMKKISVRHYK